MRFATDIVQTKRSLMDSINKNQKEQNRENLSREEAVKKINELADKKSCFFCTTPISSVSSGVRPMSVQKMDEQGNLWFLSANDSHKNKEIASDASVKLFFQGSAHSDYLYLTGKASISEDKAKIKELWQPILKTWFTEGEDDHRISVIKVEPLEGYYWDTKHGIAIAGIKMLIGAMTGKTMDDSIEGTLRV